MAKSKKQQAAIAMSMKAAGKKPKMKAGGSLKEVPSGNKGLSKLPTAVRNKMGYAKNGGTTKMKKGGIVKKSLKKYESGNTVSGPGPGDTLSKPRIPAEIVEKLKRYGPKRYPDSKEMDKFYNPWGGKEGIMRKRNDFNDKRVNYPIIKYPGEPIGDNKEAKVEYYKKGGSVGKSKKSNYGKVSSMAKKRR